MKYLKEIVINYLDTEKTNHALMITGDWGCGKTFYFKNRIIENGLINNTSLKIKRQ